MKSSGRDLREFADESVDAAIAVDTFPYLNQAGRALVSTYFAESARVLRKGGDLVILNYSYMGDDVTNAQEVAALATQHGFDVIVNGEHPFNIWDGSAYHLRKRGLPPASS